jgi:putative sigma-54 modulation protein
MMQIDIQIHLDNLADLRSYIERRINFALSRFADRLGAVKVRICDVKGPQSGVYKSCEIRVQLLPSGILLMQETRDANLYASIDYAADRIGRSLSRHLERDQDRRQAIAQTRTKTLKLRKHRTAA